MASPVIQINNANMAFADELLLQNVNISVNRGEKLVLVGPSGHGKSVLLKLMAGILRPTSGEVLIEGKNLNKLSATDRDALVKRMGFLFQKNALFDSLTSGENIAFPLRETTSLSEKEISEKIEWFLDRVAIPHARDLYPDEISGGMQKRLGIARALVLNPEIIFYDDPTAGLDPITSRMIVDLILELQEEKNATVVAVTNDMNRAYQLADTIAMVVDKELVVTGSVEDTKNHVDPRVRQFIRGELHGPLTESP